MRQSVRFALDVSDSVADGGQPPFPNGLYAPQRVLKFLPRDIVIDGVGGEVPTLGVEADILGEKGFNGDMGAPYVDIRTERGVLVIATDEEKNGYSVVGTTFNVSKAIALQASKNPELHRVLLMGLFAATKNQRFLSLRARLVAWLLK